MRKKRRRFFQGLLMCSALMSLTVCGGCGKSSGSNDVAVIVKSQGVDYWETVHKGAAEAGEEMNINIIYDAPASETNLDDQVQLVNDIVARGVDAIVLAPLDQEALNDAIKNADSKGIPVITIDSDVTAPEKKCCISTQNRSGGEIAGRAAVNILGDAGGTIAVIGHMANAQTAIERRDGFVDAVDASPNENVSILKDDIRYCDGDREKAEQQANELLDKYPEISLIYGTNETSTLGVCDALEERGLAGQIKVVGFDCSPTIAEYIENGIVNASVVQNPYNMGYLGVRYAKKLINGENISTVLDTGATLVDSENLHDENIEFLINPLNTEE